MEKAFLETVSREGLSLERYRETVERHPSTVSYWLKKHGLKAVGPGEMHRGEASEKSELEALD